MVIDDKFARGRKATVPVFNAVEVPSQGVELIDEFAIIAFDDGEASVPDVHVQKLNSGNFLGLLRAFGGEAKSFLDLLNVELTTATGVDDNALEVVTSVQFVDFDDSTCKIQFRFLKTFQGDDFIGTRAVRKDHKSGRVSVSNIHPQDVPPVLHLFRRALNQVIFGQVEHAILSVSNPLPEVLASEARILLTQAIFRSLLFERFPDILKMGIGEHSPMVDRPRYFTAPARCVVEVSVAGCVRRSGHHDLPIASVVSKSRDADFLDEALQVPLKRLTFVDHEQRAFNTAIALNFRFVTGPAENYSTPIGQGTGQIALAKLATEFDIPVDLFEDGPEDSLGLRSGESDVEHLTVWEEETPTDQFERETLSLPRTTSATSYHTTSVISDKVELGRKRKLAKFDLP